MDKEKGQGRGKARGQTHGPLGVPFKEELIMSRLNKGSRLINQIFDEGFENYTNVKSAERHVDYLLDMCGVPHHKNKLKENMGGGMGMITRPYDHPKQVNIRAIINVDSDDIEIENDMSECGPIQGEEYPGDFEGASPNNLPEEEPAKEMTPQKKQNKINTVPNQDAAGLLAAIKGEMMKESSPQYKAYFDSMLKKYGVSSPAQLPKEKKREFFNAIDKGWKGLKEGEMVDEMAIGSKAAAQIVKKAKLLRLKYKMAGKHINMKQAARLAGAAA